MMSCDGNRGGRYTLAARGFGLQRWRREINLSPSTVAAPRRSILG